MKKIFAIALALVMVLSMASAFASPCMGGFDWTKVSTTACGKAKIEVVPYVKVSNGCGGYNWQVSECAGSVKDEKVYFAIKLTVQADMDMEWWSKAALTITTTGMTSNYTKAELDKAGVVSSDKEAVYYYKWVGSGSWVKVGTDAGQISVADDVEAVSAVSDYMKGMEVFDSSKAKVCVNLNSTGNDFVEGVVGEYYVVYTPAKGAVAGTKATLTAKVADVTDLTNVYVADANLNDISADWDFAVDVAKGEIVATAKKAGVLAATPDLREKLVGNVADTFENGTNATDAAYATLKVFDKKGDADPLAIYYIGANDKVVAVDYTNAGSCAPNDMASIKAYFGIVEGTAITQKLLNKNFGWDDKAEDCFKWNATSAIVDANCVVAIPKTGDASVLAWLF